MKRTAIVFIFLLASTAITSIAFAEPNGSFTGFYIGANGGYAWGTSRNSAQTSFVANSYFEQIDISQINGDGSAILDLKKGIGGFQGGYNYQHNSFFFGSEIDFDDIYASASNVKNVRYVSLPNATYTLDTKTTTDWLFTLRPRVGVVVNRLLAYITGGVALTEIRTENSFSDNLSVLSGTVRSGARSVSNRSQTVVGGVFGFGIEYAVLKNLLFRIEYLHVMLGNAASSSPFSLNPAIIPVFAAPFSNPNPFQYSADFSTNMLRLGISYRFS